ncbi:MAG: bactofilin family protein [Bdellovibrionia bacterium]
MNPLIESTINIIAEGTRIEGKVTFENISRVHGVLIGEVHTQKNSTLVIAESAWVEGNIHADVLIVDGYVRGDILASQKVLISKTGRVIGNILAPTFIMEFGAYFEGHCRMQKLQTTEDPSTPLA